MPDHVGVPGAWCTHLVPGLAPLDGLARSRRRLSPDLLTYFN